MIGKYKLKTGETRYFYQVYINDDNNQPRYHKVRGFTKKQDAEKAETAFKHELYLNNGVYKDKETVANFMKYYFETKVKSKKAESTQDRYKIFNEDIIKYLGTEKLRDIDAMTVETFYENIRDARDLSNNTIIKLHRYFRMALDTALRNKLINYNPADLAELPKQEHSEMKYWQRENIKDNLKKLEDSFIYPIIYFATNTGMRLGEILALEWSDIDFDSKVVIVSKSIYRHDKETKVKFSPKTKSGFRKVPLFPNLISYLKRYKISQPININNLVFSDHGHYWNPKNISKYFKEELIKYNVQIIRFHDLRHTYATMLMKSKVDDLIVSKTLGHSSVAFTKNTYGHMDDDYQQEEIAKAADFLG